MTRSPNNDEWPNLSDLPPPDETPLSFTQQVSAWPLAISVAIAGTLLLLFALWR